MVVCSSLLLDGDAYRISSDGVAFIHGMWETKQVCAIRFGSVGTWKYCRNRNNDEIDLIRCTAHGSTSTISKCVYIKNILLMFFDHGVYSILETARRHENDTSWIFGVHFQFHGKTWSVCKIYRRCILKRAALQHQNLRLINTPKPANNGPWNPSVILKHSVICRFHYPQVKV